MQRHTSTTNSSEIQQAQNLQQVRVKSIVTGPLKKDELGGNRLQPLDQAQSLAQQEESQQQKIVSPPVIVKPECQN